MRPVLGSTEIMLLNLTGCGFTTFTDEELNAKLAYGGASKTAGITHPYSDCPSGR